MLFVETLQNVQSVQQTVSDPAEIDSLFDGAIVYAKGSHLIFMLMRAIGEQNFFKGLKDYFQKFQYMNTTGDDLWACLQKYAEFDVKKLMDSWILQSGFPVINGNHQQRFLADGSTDKTTWILPKISDDMSGHYIIQLSDSEFAREIANFKHLKFEQKLRLLIDRSLLMRTSYIKTSSVLDLLLQFKEEKLESIWQIILVMISNLKIFFPPDSENFKLFQKYITLLAADNLSRLTINPLSEDTQDDLKLRPLILNFAIYAENQDVMRSLSEIYHQKIGDKMDFTTVSPELLDSIIAAEFRFDKEKHFDKLLDRYKTEANPAYKSVILDTITDSRDPKHIAQLIHLLEDQNTVRLQDHLFLLSALLSNFWSKKDAFAWFYEHWDYIKKITDNKSIDDYIRIVGARVSNEEEAKIFLDFCQNEKKNPAVARAIKIAEYGIKITLEWKKREAQGVYNKISEIIQ